MLRSLRQLPNLISSLRILLVVPIAWSLGRHELVTTLWLFLAAAVSDAADGFLARRFGWQTKLGGMLDPIADKLMLATVFVSLAYLGLVPFWLTAVVLLRDVIIVLGAVAFRLLVGPVEAAPSMISKLNTVLQMTFVLSAIGRERFAMPSAGVVVALGAAVFVMAAISGVDYVLVYGRRAGETLRTRRGIGPAQGSRQP